MKEKYPFFNFYFKTELEKGHAKSMNIILKNVHTPYILHLEDDWEFYVKNNFIRNCLEVLNADPKLGQCLFNRNYAETFDQTIVGGLFHTTPSGLRYFINE